MSEIIERKDRRIEDTWQLEDIFANQQAWEDTARAAEEKGVSAIIFRSPCIAVVKPNKALTVDADKCIGCKICLNKLGCPALVMENGKAKVEPGLCTGCTLCSQVCPKKAIG